ncbi:hypothetical protein STENM223S_06668 [Streptomyces tendae]|uniref:Uncharacterized protein n=1 Tax=Streptomyces pseudogriseolus TaxID=36817 RepID=A0ABQ2TFL8_STREZ|nr:hypothetical protein GCM10010285_49250 [Streptomyces rubiginosus]
MEELTPQGQSAPGTPPIWVTGVTYGGALLAGVVLIMSGHASPAEASGYVAPFLVVYEKLAQRRRGF